MQVYISVPEVLYEGIEVDLTGVRRGVVNGWDCFHRTVCGEEEKERNSFFPGVAWGGRKWR